MAEHELKIKRAGSERRVPIRRQFVIGAKLDADIHLTEPGIAPTHAVITPSSRGGFLWVFYQGDDAEVPVLVNGTAVKRGHPLVHGDEVEIGPLRIECLFNTISHHSTTQHLIRPGWERRKSTSKIMDTQAISWASESSASDRALMTLYRLLYLTNTVSTESTFLEKVLQLTMGGVEAVRGAVVLHTSGGRLQPVALEYATGDVPGALGPFRLGTARTSVVQGVTTRTVHEDGSPGIYVPIVHGAAAPEGAICCTRQPGSMPFADADMELLAAVGRQIAVGLRRIRWVEDASPLQEQILEISQREQQRIGQDLHDGLCQDLVGIAYLTKHLQKRLADLESPVAEDAQQIVDLIHGSTERARSLARGLNPVALEANGLSAALDELADHVRRVFGLECTFRCDEQVLLHDNSLASHLYYLGREAVNNAARHSGGTRIDIELRGGEDRVMVVVTDDGQGLPDDVEEATGMGLRIMRYRARLIGATLTYSTHEGRGVRVVCTLPLAFEAGGGKARYYLISTSLDAPLQLVPEHHYVVGRDDRADVRVRSGMVSRRHAEIRWDAAAEAFVLADLGSTNGTIVNDCRVDEPCTLHDRDVLNFGGNEVVLRLVDRDQLPLVDDNGSGGTQRIQLGTGTAEPFEDEGVSPDEETERPTGRAFPAVVPKEGYEV